MYGTELDKTLILWQYQLKIMVFWGMKPCRLVSEPEDRDTAYFYKTLPTQLPTELHNMTRGRS